MLRNILRHFFITLLAISAADGAAGQTFEVSPGELAARHEVPAQSAVITVTGSIDASDLDYLVTAIEDVQTLDLSGADIVAYSGKKVGVNTYSSPANVLPAYIMAGLRVSHLMLPLSLTAIGDGALMDARLTEVDLPAGVESIGRDAFAQCRSLTRVALPEGVTEVADRAFEGCEQLAEVSLPSTLQTVGARAFLGCVSLQKLDMSGSLSSIGDEAFATSGLDAIALDGCAGLGKIGKRAFARCMHLESATLPSGAVNLGEGIFFECRSLNAVKLPDAAVVLPALTLKGAENLTEIELPEGMTEIGELAMAGMSAVEHLTLPPSLGHLAEGAMEGCTGVKEIDAMQLDAVPTLGDEVWAGVQQQDVTLRVREGLENSFLATPQWQEFAIGKSSITQLPGMKEDGSMIEVRFIGTMLAVSAPDVLKSVTLYGIDGRLLSVTDNIDANSVNIETSRHPGAFFIIKIVTGTDSKGETFKLMRGL